MGEPLLNAYDTRSTTTPPNHAPPNHAPPIGTPPASNGLAAAAVVVGTAGLLTSVAFVGGPLGVIGLVLGTAALLKARRTGTGRGAAATAVVTSSLAIVVSGLVAVLFVWYANRTQACYQPDSLHQYTECVRQHLSRN
ncbi:DUF4190 domain-containing protein [Kitasatospora sp. NPDC048722]|uniref:DUF4190 domain-containing protein n=1 Tax=Kitasatospora sp. NPDC048722 TaxID=3155639 RepID=UPI0033FDBADC